MRSILSSTASRVLAFSTPFFLGYSYAKGYITDGVSSSSDSVWMALVCVGLALSLISLVATARSKTAVA